MATIRQLPSGAWNAQIRIARLGKLGTASQTFKTEHQARAWADKREKELILARKHLRDDEVYTPGMTFNYLINSYFKGEAFANKKESTQKQEIKRAKPMREWFVGWLASDVTDLGLQLYLNHRRDSLALGKNGEPIKVLNREGRYEYKKLAGDTVRLDKALLQSICRHAVKWRLIKDDPARSRLEVPKLNKRVIRIKHNEQVKLERAAADLIASNPRANKSTAAWLAFVFGTGTRPGEAARIKIDWVKSEFDLKTESAAYFVEIPEREQKNALPRTIFIPSKISSIIAAQRAAALEAGSPYLFWSRTNKRTVNGKRNRYSSSDEREFQPFVYAGPWKKICKRAGLPEGVVPHGIRHEYISRLFETSHKTGLNETRIANLVGDKHIASLQRYTHLAREKNKTALELFDKIDSAMKQDAIAVLDAFQVEGGVERLLSERIAATVEAGKLTETGANKFMQFAAEKAIEESLKLSKK